MALGGSGGPADPLRRLVIGAGAAAPIALLMPRAGLASAARPFDRAGLDRALARAARFDQIHGLIVARDGEMVVREAFRGPGLGRPVNVKSVSKTIVASLVGAAIDRGVLRGPEQRLAEIAPDLIPRNADPRVRDITLAQLLTMQAGLERTSGPNYGRWVESRNWVAFALSRPFVAEPGGGMLYSTGSYHVLGAVLAQAAGRSLLALARDWLGDPLGIEFRPWTRDPQGFYLGGNNMVLSPEDLFRFGEMWRNGGLRDGRRVLSAAWIEASWMPRTRSPFSGDQYGYGWFLAEMGGRPVAYARGYGGQMLYLVPTLGLTVVVSSDPTRPARSEGYVGDLEAILAEEIIPAAERGAPG
ncbi:serine hydrolase domain-containing protein [Arenibaculum pallidiluteum]|uniref:serine hydrolase domain-containing protein n=1 Tax=Arenibaculum pallidiluteum TaxID=2812559 RepID=UPI001A967A55|nr:serine hydrolase [Arenibaculum pallidiluteum]